MTEKPTLKVSVKKVKQIIFAKKFITAILKILLAKIVRQLFENKTEM